MMLKRKMLRYALMEKHMMYVHTGEYDCARLLLRLMKHGKVCLGLDDSSADVENFLEGIGLTPHYSSNYNICTFRLPVEKE